MGGDKTGQWAKWYATAIPEAERLYETHLDDLVDEGVLNSDQKGADDGTP